MGGANGNLGPADETTYEWVRICAPFTAHVRAKFFKVDTGDAETWLDYGRLVGILDEAGFNGTLGIVFEGGDVNEGLSDREVFAICAGQLRALTAPGRLPLGEALLLPKL